MPRIFDSFHHHEPEPLPEVLEHWLREDLPRQYKAHVEFLRQAGFLELFREDQNARTGRCIPALPWIWRGESLSTIRPHSAQNIRVAGDR